MVTSKTAQRAPAGPKPRQGGPLVVAHIGDLHMTALGAPSDPVLMARQRQLRADLDTILGQLAQDHVRTIVDLVYLPGDLAEDGAAAQYAPIAAALKRHALPDVRLITGDHDRQTGDMSAFEAFFDAVMPAEHTREQHRVERQRLDAPSQRKPLSIRQFYYAETVRTVRCIFADLVSAGYGQKGLGLDFRLGAEQLDWVKAEIAEARGAGQRVAVFMHAYPADFRERDEGALVAGLLWNSGVSLVEMGHTHYNELAHDGRTLYAAARSVGQNEDGPAGFAIVALDGDVVSWRFKQLQQTWPFVMITSPADRRLATGRLSDGDLVVRAIVLSDRPASDCLCRCSVDNGAPVDMLYDASEGVFHVAVPWPPGSRIVTVTVSYGKIDGHDSFDFDMVEQPDSDFRPKPLPGHPGSDHFAVGAWLRKGVRGDQLGPNKGGRKW